MTFSDRRVNVRHGGHVFHQSKFNEGFCIDVFGSCKLKNIELRIINHKYNSPCDPFKSQLKLSANKNY